MTNETEAPERIWASPADIFDGMDIWQSNKTSRDTEYTRADLYDAQAARIAELEAQNRELALQIISSDGQAMDAYDAQMKAEQLAAQLLAELKGENDE